MKQPANPGASPQSCLHGRAAHGIAASLCLMFCLGALLPQTIARSLQEASPAAEASPSPAQLLAAREEGDTPLLDDLRELCDGIGGRQTGTPACARAVRWAAERFRAAGIQSTSIESYSVPNSWEGGADSARCVEPAEFPVRLVAAPFTAPTPGGEPIEAQVLSAGDGSPEAFERLGSKARGAIALVMTPEMHNEEDLFAEYARDPSLFAAAEKAGVAAVLVESSRPGVVLYRHPMQLGSGNLPIPGAIVARIHAERLARLCARGEVRMRLDLPSRLGGAYEAQNVVAEIRGSEWPNQIVLIGAHLDSWDLGTGAQDNGVNAVTEIDIARSFKALGLTPRRTVRFALFTGEEQGMLGSEAYVLQHAAEMGHHVAMVTFDTGSGHTDGFYLDGRDDLRGPINQALGAVPGMEAYNDTVEAVDGTDNFDFLLSGIPNVIAKQEWAPYLPSYHAETDVYDAVNRQEARKNAALAAVLIWGLAENPNLPARQTRSQVEKLLRASGLDEQMKTLGQWDDWAAGRRGVNR